MKHLGRKGSTLIFVIVSMTAISVLGTGIYFMTTSAAFSVIDFNEQFRTYQLTLAARDSALTMTLLPGTYTMSDGRKFQIAINGDTITTTVIFQGGTPQETTKTVSITKTSFSTQAGISLAESIAAISATQPTAAPSDFISKTDTEISLGKVGSSYQNLFGAAVYSGNAVQGNCVAGKCDFGTGFNAFLVFQFASGSTGDGFTFAFFNGSNNQANSVGGYAGSGELMGYAGDSFVSGTTYLDGQGGRGIQPPKFAVEFDPYTNTGSGCFSGRNDGSLNHMSLVFWGDNTTSCTSTVGKYTFDDNLHGNGTNGAEDPKNGLRTSAGGDACSYFNGSNVCGGGTLSWPSNWLLNYPSNVYALRVEARRKLTPETSGNYRYRFKVWIKRCTSNNPTCASDYADNADYLNTKVDYTADSPYLDRTIEISSAYHAKFATTFFGWTLATGGAMQSVNINRFKMNFLQ